MNKNKARVAISPSRIGPKSQPMYVAVSRLDDLFDEYVMKRVSRHYEKTREKLFLFV